MQADKILLCELIKLALNASSEPGASNIIITSGSKKTAVTSIRAIAIISKAYAATTPKAAPHTNPTVAPSNIQPKR
jgi:hypothetical protein